PEMLIRHARRHGVASHPVVRQRIADAHIRFEVLRFLGYRMQTALSQGRTPGNEASIMKLAFARYMKALTETAIEVGGPHGMLASEEIGRAACRERAENRVK